MCHRGSFFYELSVHLCQPFFVFFVLQFICLCEFESYILQEFIPIFTPQYKHKMPPEYFINTNYIFVNNAHFRPSSLKRVFGKLRVLDMKIV